MTRLHTICRCCLVAGLVVNSLAIVGGCGTNAGQNAAEKFVPSPKQADDALRAVFESWKQDVPPGMVPGTSPAVHVTDTLRKPGEKLIDYRILGEVPSEQKRCFAVELRFEPERAERTRFLVVGIDPLWVFRLEDAENLAHWEHAMESPDGAASERSAAESTEDQPSPPTSEESTTSAPPADDKKTPEGPP